MAFMIEKETKQGTSYLVSWREGDGRNGGKRREVSKTFRDRTEAKRHLRYVEEHIESRRVGGSKRETAHVYLDRWVSELPEGLSPTTIEGYTDKINIAKRELPDVALLKLQGKDFTVAYKKLLKNGKLLPNGKRGPLSLQTVKHVHTVLHNAFEVARKDKLVSENPVEFATPPSKLVDEDDTEGEGEKYKRKVRGYTLEEANRQIDLLQNSTQHPPDTLVMTLVLFTGGLRRGELLGLADDSIDFEKSTISIFRTVKARKQEVIVKKRPKTAASVRTLQMPSAVMEQIRAQMTRVREAALAYGRDYQRKPMYLFPGTGGAAMHPKLVTHRFTRLIRHAKIENTDDISPVHSWRHTHGTLLWNATKDDKLVQTRSGHSTPWITKALYVESTPEKDAEAADFFNSLVKTKGK